MTLSSKRAAVSLVVTAAVVTAACGTSAGNSTAPTPTTSALAATSPTTPRTTTISALERQALDVAYGGEFTSPSALESLKRMCVIPNYAYLGYPDPPSESQAHEIKGALILCPDAPAAAELQAKVAQTDAIEKNRSEGRVFGPGVFLIGSQIQPGTYAASNGKGCYWERQDRNGEIIDNGFHNNAARVQVTIRPSDYAFSSERCGEWQPA